jgi:hypothetical protein
MAMEGVATTINRGGLVGEVVSINLPDNEVKEFECTTLDDVREQFAPSAMFVGQEVSLTVRLTKDAQSAIAVGSSNSATVITTSGGSTYTFDDFCRSATGGVADVGATEGITQDIVLRLTSEVAFVAG